MCVICKEIQNHKTLGSYFYSSASVSLFLMGVVLAVPCVPNSRSYFWDEKLTWNLFLKLTEILCEAILKRNKKILLLYWILEKEK